MNKKIKQFSVTPGMTTFPVQLTFSSGIETPRYIICAFQSIPITLTKQKINNLIFNIPSNQYKVINVNNVNLYINGNIYQLNDYQNDFTTNKVARWYNEYKKFIMTYNNNDFDENNCISYQDFNNLNRIYVFDVSKQLRETITNGIANVKIEFNFITPIPVAANAAVIVYCMSLYDRIWSLKSDGTKQYIIK